MSVDEADSLQAGDVIQNVFTNDTFLILGTDYINGAYIFKKSLIFVKTLNLQELKVFKKYDKIS